MSSITDFFKSKRRSTEPHSTYGLTTLGKQKAEQYSSTNPHNTVLSHLNENGVSTISEISQETKYPPNKVKLILGSLLRSGYVRKVNQEE